MELVCIVDSLFTDMAISTSKIIALMEQERRNAGRASEGGALEALASQFAAFAGGMTLGKIYRSAKGFFSGATAGAERFAEDPIAQLLYQQFIAPAYKLANKQTKPEKILDAYGKIEQGVDAMNEFLHAYVVSLRRVVDAASRNPSIRIADYAWAPGEFKGAIGSRSLAFLNSDMRDYEEFPLPYIMSDEIMPIAGASLVKGCLSMIAVNYPLILAEKAIREAHVNGVTKAMLKLIHTFTSAENSEFGIKSSLSSMRDGSYAQDVSLKGFVGKVNKRSNGGLVQLRVFVETVDANAAEFAKSVNNGALEKLDVELADGNPADDDKPVTKMITDPNKLKFESKVVELVMAEIDRMISEAELDEASSMGGASGVADIAGYSLPLGDSNQEYPDSEMDKTIKKSGWSRLPTSDKNIAPAFKDKFKKNGNALLQTR